MNSERLVQERFEEKWSRRFFSTLAISVLFGNHSAILVYFYWQELCDYSTLLFQFIAERLARGHLGGDYDQKADCTFER